MNAFRLIEFNVYDKKQQHQEDSEVSNKDNKEFMVQMFGINEQGETCCLFVTGYKPFFYVLVPDNWKLSNLIGFIGDLREKLGEYYEDSIVQYSFVKKKKLYGFDGGKQHKFIKIDFDNEAAMKRASEFDYNTIDSKIKTKIPVGIFYQVEKPVLEEQLTKK